MPEYGFPRFYQRSWGSRSTICWSPDVLLVVLGPLYVSVKHGHQRIDVHWIWSHHG